MYNYNTLTLVSLLGERMQLVAMISGSYQRKIGAKMFSKYVS